MRLLIEVLLMGLALLIGAYLVPGVAVNGLGYAIIAAVLIALANATLGFVLRIFTLPLNFLTLGLVSFIISILMILLVDRLMDNFNTSGFLSATVLAIVVTIVKMILDAILGLDKKN